MNAVISRILSSVKLGEPTSVMGLTLVPLFSEMAAGPRYDTLSEALSAGTLVVAELDSGGHVPELRARNDGGVGVLVLDGEELRGAKQNRVLNTTVYLAPGREIVIPVSCVEQGRWHYLSNRFQDSGYVANHSVRLAAKESVTSSVRARGAYHSDQGKVWLEVDRLGESSGVRSETRAMRDVYEQKRSEIDDLLGKTEAEGRQKGLLAVFGGRVVGMDLVSRTEAYAKLHERLVRSYAVEAMLGSALPGPDDVRTAKEFITSLAEVEATSHPSPGSGTSHRFTGPGIVGDALTYRSAVLHAAFFTAK